MKILKQNDKEDFKLCPLWIPELIEREGEILPATDANWEPLRKLDENWDIRLRGITQWKRDKKTGIKFIQDQSLPPHDVEMSRFLKIGFDQLKNLNHFSREYLELMLFVDQEKENDKKT